MIVLVLIFAAIFAFAAYYFLVSNDRQIPQLDIPGTSPSHSALGNLPDITKAGSLHQFLTDLHKKYGPIASFWFDGNHQIVSTSDVTTFKPQMQLFDRPVEIFNNLKPAIGEFSIQYQNGERGHELRHYLDKPYTAHACNYYIPTLVEIAEEFAEKFTKIEDGKVQLHDTMLSFTLQAIMRTSFGDYFKNREACHHFVENYDATFHELDDHLADKAKPLSEKFHKAMSEMKAQIKQISLERRDNPPADGGRLLVDDILDVGKSDQEIFDLAITYVIGGFHTSGNLLCWLLYHLSSHPEIQDKLRQEFIDAMGDEAELGEHHFKSLDFTRKVIDETLRVSILAPYAARIAPAGLKISGYSIPKGTSILQALGVAHHNENTFPEPEKFDPSRFDTLHEHYGDNMACPFFGFGKRKCPGYRFAYVEVYCFLSVVLRKFKFTLAEPGKKIGKIMGLVSHPAEEITAIVEKI